LIRKSALEALSVGGSGQGTPSSAGTSRITLLIVLIKVTATGHKKRKKLLLGSNMGDQSDLVTNASYQVYPRLAALSPCRFRVDGLEIHCMATTADFWTT
jgi:hypothetical protein